MTDKLYKNKEFLYKKYVIEKISAPQIAILCSCSPNTIYRNLNKFDIKVRPVNESINTEINWCFLKDENWLYKKYINEYLSTIEIAKICNCGNVLVGKQLKKFNIETRSKNKAQNPNASWELLNNKKWMCQKYITERLNTYKISKICNCTPATVRSYLLKYDILLRKQSGEKHYNWKNGASFTPYCRKFNKKLKEKIRESFNRKCLICGKIEKENGKNLSIHHIDYNKMQGCGYKWTLIPLCSSCRSKTNGSRYYWFNLLNNYWLLNPEINFYDIILFIKGD